MTIRAAHPHGRQEKVVTDLPVHGSCFRLLGRGEKAEKFSRLLKDKSPQWEGGTGRPVL